MRVRSGDTVLRVPLDEIDPDFRRAELRLEGLRPPIPSYEARFFIDDEDANARTPTASNVRYLGTHYFYGLGVADASPQSHGVYDGDAPTQSSRRQIVLNVTQRLRAYLAQVAPHVAPVTVVATGKDGEEIAEPDLDLEGFSLATS